MSLIRRMIESKVRVRKLDSGGVKSVVFDKFLTYQELSVAFLKNLIVPHIKRGDSVKLSYKSVPDVWIEFHPETEIANPYWKPDSVIVEWPSGHQWPTLRGTQPWNFIRTSVVEMTYKAKKAVGLEWNE